MDLNSIYTDFKKLETNEDRVSYLETLRGLKLPFEINYDNLIRYWTNHVERSEEDEEEYQVCFNVQVVKQKSRIVTHFGIYNRILL